MQCGGLSTKLLIVLIEISPPLVQEIVLLILHRKYNSLDKEHRSLALNKSAMIQLSLVYIAIFKMKDWKRIGKQSCKKI